MRHVKWTHLAAGILAAAAVNTAAIAAAQNTPAGPWNVEFAIGWDNDISGNINGSGIGDINGQTVVITRNTYEQVYGTGLHLRGGVGYLTSGGNTELRATITFQSLDAAPRSGGRRENGTQRRTTFSSNTRGCSSLSSVLPDTRPA